MPLPGTSSGHPPESAATSVPPSERIPALEGVVIAGKFKVLRLIGRGGMGTVWLAHHLAIDQPVAIKFIHTHLAESSDARRRFETEARAAAKLKSRHAVTVYDHGQTDAGQPYIVMEYLEGEALDRAVARRGPIPVREVSHIVNEAAKALSVAHAAGVVHRDLKPDNIFLAKHVYPESSEFGYTVKLVDFGIAKIVHDGAASGAAATQAGMVLGTPHFMSPEGLTASSPVGPATDMWSLGACAYAAAVGKVPFEGKAIGEVLLKVCTAPLPVPSKENPALPPGFDAWFARACHRDVTRRFQTALEMAAALATAVDGREPVLTMPELPPEIVAATPAETSLPEPARAVAPPARDERAYDAIQGSLSLAPRVPNRVAWAAGIVVGVTVTVGGLGTLVWNQKAEADEAMRRTAASAAAAIEAENARRLEEASRLFFGDGGTDAAVNVPRPSPADSKGPRHTPRGTSGIK